MPISGQEPLHALPTEAQNLDTRNLDKMDPLQFARALHAADQQVLAAVELVLPQIAGAIVTISGRVQAGGRLFYLGAGTSGRLGVLDASECPPTFSSPPEMVQGVIAGGEQALRFAVEGAEDDPYQAAVDLATRDFRREDTLVGIAASGRTPYVLGGLAHARSLGAWTVGLSCVPGSPIAVVADLAITPDTGPEVIAGSTRMKAGTATKLLLNAISTGVMVQLGFVYDNLMVNVQSTNSKLSLRAQGIVGALTGLDQTATVDLLEHAGSVRVAVVMHRLNVSRGEAETLLSQAGGRLRTALGE